MDGPCKLIFPITHPLQTLQVVQFVGAYVNRCGKCLEQRVLATLAHQWIVESQAVREGPLRTILTLI